MKHLSESIYSKKTGKYNQFPTEPDVEKIEEFLSKNGFENFTTPTTFRNLRKQSNRLNKYYFSVSNGATGNWIKFCKPGTNHEYGVDGKYGVYRVSDHGDIVIITTYYDEFLEVVHKELGFQ